MGQIKGNPALDRTPERQAYTDFYGVGGAAYRSVGSQPVMIGARETLNDVVDATFATDSDLSANAAADALKATISSQNALSASLSNRLTITGSCANDAAAESAGVPVGGLYHTTGTIKVRLV